MKQNTLDFPFEYWLRVLGDFLIGFGRSMIVPFMLIYLNQESGWAIWIITLLTAAPQFLQLFTTSWGGVLADYYGRKPVMFLSLVVSGATLLLMFSHNYLIVYAGYFLFQALSNIYRPAALAKVTEVVQPELHRSAFAIMRTVANLGFALGPLAGSYLFFNHRPLAVCGTITTYVLTACMVFLMQESKTSLIQRNKNLVAARRPLESFTLLKQDTVLLWAVIAGVFFLMVQGQIFSTLTVVINDAFRDNGRTLSYLLLINTLGVASSQYYITSITRKLSFSNLLFLAILVSAAGWGTLLLNLGPLRFYILLVLTTVAEMLMAAGYTPYIASLAHEEKAARYLSFTQTSSILGSMIGPVIGAAGLDLGGQKGFVTVLWVLSLLSYGSLLILKRKTKTAYS